MGWNNLPVEFEIGVLVEISPKREASGCPKGQIFLSVSMFLSDDNNKSYNASFSSNLFNTITLAHSFSLSFFCCPFQQPRSVWRISFQIAYDMYQVPHPWTLHKQWNPKIAFQHCLISTSIKQQQGLPKPEDWSCSLQCTSDRIASGFPTIVLSVSVNGGKQAAKEKDGCY